MCHSRFVHINRWNDWANSKTQAPKKLCVGGGTQVALSHRFWALFLCYFAYILSLHQLITPYHHLIAPVVLLLLPVRCILEATKSWPAPATPGPGCTSRPLDGAILLCGWP